MVTHIIDFLAGFVVHTIGVLGYPGVFLLMLVESCGIPMPSEITMPFSGFLVAEGRLSFWLVALMGALGNLVGSWLAYWIGWKGGRPLIERYGKYILISRHDLDMADRWFVKYGDWTAFFGRLLPIIRTYISFPCGVSRMNFTRFSLFTFFGALPWSALLAYAGVKLGSHWEMIREKLHNFDLAVGALIVLAIVWYVWRHVKHAREAPPDA